MYFVIPCIFEFIIYYLLSISTPSFSENGNDNEDTHLGRRRCHLTRNGAEPVPLFFLGEGGSEPLPLNSLPLIGNRNQSQAAKKAKVSSGEAGAEAEAEVPKPKPMGRGWARARDRGRPQTEAVHGVKMPEIAKRQLAVVVVVAAKV